MRRRGMSISPFFFFPPNNEEILVNTEDSSSLGISNISFVTNASCSRFTENYVKCGIDQHHIPWNISENGVVVWRVGVGQEGVLICEDHQVYDRNEEKNKV